MIYQLVETDKEALGVDPLLSECEGLMLLKEEIIATVTRESLWDTSMIEINGTTGVAEIELERPHTESEYATLALTLETVPQDLGMDFPITSSSTSPPPQHDDLSGGF